MKKFIITTTIFMLFFVSSKAQNDLKTLLDNPKFETYSFNPALKIKATNTYEFKKEAYRGAFGRWYEENITKNRQVFNALYLILRTDYVFSLLRIDLNHISPDSTVHVVKINRLAIKKIAELYENAYKNRLHDKIEEKVHRALFDEFLTQKTFFVRVNENPKLTRDLQKLLNKHKDITVEKRRSSEKFQTLEIVTNRLSQADVYYTLETTLQEILKKRMKDTNIEASGNYFTITLKQDK